MVKVKKKKGEINFVQKNISITKKQEEWIDINYVNLSRFVQGKLEEIMSK